MREDDCDMECLWDNGPPKSSRNSAKFVEQSWRSCTAHAPAKTNEENKTQTSKMIPLSYPGINFTNILQATFARSKRSQKRKNRLLCFWDSDGLKSACVVTCWWNRPRCQFHQYFMSSFVCTKVFCTAFLCLQFGFIIFWRKNIGKKAACKRLVKYVTEGVLGGLSTPSFSVLFPIILIILKPFLLNHPKGVN